MPALHLEEGSSESLLQHDDFKKNTMDKALESTL